MKTLQIFAVGVAILIAVVYLPAYQSMIAGFFGLAIVGIVVAGFALTPKREILYVRTSDWDIDVDGELSLEHDRLAIRVQLTRLSLLFVPTFAAVAFLLVTYARGTTWKVDLLDALTPPLFSVRPWLFYVLEVGGFVLWYVLSRWIHERRVFRDAEACSASSFSQPDARYHFVTKEGDYYGGTHGRTLRFLSRTRELSYLVCYRRTNPSLNVIGAALVFHKLTILGRGLTDLDEGTVAARLREIKLPAV